MVTHLFRDTFIGQLIYLASGRKYFQHPEDQDDFEVPEKYKSGSSGKKTGNSANKTEKKEKRSDRDELTDGRAERDSSSERTVVGDEQEEGEDQNLVDWYGPDDSENPMNWSKPRKFFVTFCICLITTSVYSGSSIYTPGLMQAMEAMHVGQVPATLGLSMFVLGYGTGPLFLSPMTEIPQVGRTAPYIITLAIYVALQIPAALTNNFAGFIIIRFLQGFFGSPPLATGGASISDMYGPTTRPLALGVWGLSAASGPALGPVLSGFAIMNLGWHWHAWIMLMLAGSSLIFLALTLPETSAINILVRRAQRLRKCTGNQELKSQGEIEAAEMTGKDIAKMTLIRPFQLTFSEPPVMALNLYTAYVYALLYCFFESLPLVYSKEGFYRWNLGVSQLPFLSLLVGAVIGYAGYAVWNQKYYVPKYDASGGKLPPEERLPPAIVGAFFFPIYLFWFGWSSGRTSWVSPTIALAFNGIGTTLMFQGILNYLPDAYPTYAASVLASNDFLRSYFGAAFPLFASIMFKHLGIDWGCSLLGFISVAMIPIPYVLYKYGHRIRKRSKWAETS